MLNLIGLRVCSELTTFQTGWIFAAVKPHLRFRRVKIATVSAPAKGGPEPLPCPEPRG